MKWHKITHCFLKNDIKLHKNYIKFGIVFFNKIGRQEKKSETAVPDGPNRYQLVSIHDMCHFLDLHFDSSLKSAKKCENTVILRTVLISSGLWSA